MAIHIRSRQQKSGGPSGPPGLVTVRRHSSGNRFVCLLCSVFLVLLFAVQVTAPALAAEQADPGKMHPREKTLMKRQWGIEVLFVRSTSAGYMLEFRYKVLDPEKAKPLFERRTKPALIHAKSGATFVVPTPAKTGALRNSNPPIKDRTYWMFFANPGQYVKQGDTVRVEIGDFVADGIVVE